jgi:hypothetical protein
LNFDFYYYDSYPFNILDRITGELIKSRIKNVRDDLINGEIDLKVSNKREKLEKNLNSILIGNIYKEFKVRYNKDRKTVLVWFCFKNIEN